MKKYLLVLILVAFVAVPFLAKAQAGDSIDYGFDGSELTVADLQAMISQLQADLTARENGQETTCVVEPFTKDLSMGLQDPQVLALQSYLINHEYLAPGNLTGYFGNLTKDAVIRYQTAKGIVPAAGYFGLLSRTELNAELCGSNPPDQTLTCGSASGVYSATRPSANLCGTGITLTSVGVFQSSGSWVWYCGVPSGWPAVSCSAPSSQIIPPEPGKTVTVTAPSGSVVAGNPTTAGWTSTGFDSLVFSGKIYLYRDNNTMVMSPYQNNPISGDAWNVSTKSGIQSLTLRSDLTVGQYKFVMVVNNVRYESRVFAVGNPGLSISGVTLSSLTYHPNDPVGISWTSVGVNNVIITYSKLGSGGNYTTTGWVTHPEVTSPSGHWVSNLNSFNYWTIPATAEAGSYQIKVFNYDQNNLGAGGSYASDPIAVSPIFTIAPQDQIKSLTVVSPKGGETLKAGQATNITWSSTGLSATDNISIWLQDTQKYCPTGLAGCWTSYLIANTTNTGSYNWDANTVYGDGGPNSPVLLANTSSNLGINKYKILVKISNPSEVPQVSDTSDSVFTVVGDNVNIRNLNLNVPSTVTAGQQMAMSWTSTGYDNTGIYGYLYLYPANGSTAVSNPYTQYSYQSYWNIPLKPGSLYPTLRSTIPSGQYKFKITSNYGNYESPVFNLQNGAVTPTITITSPNGGETWTRGNTYTIAWTTSNLPSGDNVSISLVGNGQVWLASNLSPSNGSHSYSWTVPAQSALFPARTDYKIQIEDQQGLTLGASARTFTIAETTPTPINGSCGSANGVSVSATPSASLCSAGTLSGPVYSSGGTTWLWSCASTNGGTTASCTAPRTYAVAKTLTFTKPAIDSLVIKGIPFSVAWNSTGYDNTGVTGQLYLYTAAGSVVSAPYTQYSSQSSWNVSVKPMADGQFNPTLRATIPDGQYKFVLVSNNDSGRWESGVFNVSASPNRSGGVPITPTITSVAIASQVHPGDSNVSINWNSTGVSQVLITWMKLDSSGNATAQDFVTRQIDNTGSYSWSVPTTLTPGSYQVKVFKYDSAAGGTGATSPYESSDIFQVINSQSRTDQINQLASVLQVIQDMLNALTR